MYFLISCYPIYWSINILPLCVPNPYQPIIELDHHVEVAEEITPQDKLIRIAKILTTKKIIQRFRPPISRTVTEVLLAMYMALRIAAANIKLVRIRSSLVKRILSYALSALNCNWQIPGPV